MRLAGKIRLLFADRKFVYKEFCMKKGFTLIELLVVVLIIGILAAVALPQYEKVVEKSKGVQALALLKPIYNAQEVYFLANGDYADQFDELDVDIPWTGRDKMRNDVVDVRSNEDWSLHIYKDYATHALLLYRRTGPYAGRGFSIGGRLPANQQETGRLPGVLHCDDTSSRGDYCKKLFHGELVYSGSKYVFTIPNW